ncbi:large-conductance mechanosensitive channel [Batrachochytrium salamandrivorans]|nr:large-conductance mechanosensitive channel [Batrachochytrium salamandrivorans]
MSSNHDSSNNKFQNVGNQLKGGAFKSVKAVGSVLDDFKAFLNRGNVVDLAVGIVMGAAFTAIVTSMVADLITPLIGLATQSNPRNMFYILRCPANQTTCRSVGGYSTPAEANKAGLVTWNYGRFLQICINFVIISMIVFFIVKVYTAAFCRKAPVEHKECGACIKTSPFGHSLPLLHYHDLYL